MLVRVIKVKLSPDSEQIVALTEMFHQFNAACNWISEVAFREKAFKQVPLHAACYHAVREKFGLPAQLAVRAIGKVLETYRRDKSACHTYGPFSAIVYDSRVFRLEGVTYASLTLLHSRQKIRLDCGSYQRKHLAGKPVIGQVDLLHENGQFTLAISLRRPEPPQRETEGFLGVDLGITEVATDSEGNQYSGEAVKACRRRYREFRRGLQQNGKKGAKRRLKAISRKQSRFVRHTNHVISKQLVATASKAGKALALEDLSGIRERSNGYAASMRWLLGNWAFFQLRAFVEYKTADTGLPVTLVDPKNTSRRCSHCGHCEKANRKSQAVFLCLECGFQSNADFNAALNLAVRGLETRAVTFGFALLRQGFL
jgi:putative transposase